MRKNIVKISAAVLALIIVITAFNACGKNGGVPDGKKDADAVANKVAWALEPSITAQAIEPLVQLNFNETTCHYDFAYADCFRIKVDGKYGIIDLNGKIVVKPEYDDLFAIWNRGDYLAVNDTDDGKVQTYIHGDTFETERAYKKYNSEKYEYYWNTAKASPAFVSVSSQESETLDCRPISPEAVKGVTVLAGSYKETGKFGLYANARNITGMIYTGAGYFTNGMAAFESNGKWGYLDSNGRTVAAFVYDAVKGYSAFGGKDTPYESFGGYITVTKDSKFGIIRNDGEQMIDFIYSGATPVVEGKAFVLTNGKWGVIDIDPDLSESASTAAVSASSSAVTTEPTTEERTTEKTTEKITERSTSDETEQENEEKFNTGTYTVSDDYYLNLRTGAGTGNSIVTSIPGGETVYVDEVEDGWGHTVWQGHEGWINLRYAEKH